MTTISKPTTSKPTTSKPTTSKPTTSKTAAFLARAIHFSGKTQAAIAREAGFPKPNVLSMMKQGQTKVPIERIPELARACNVDAAYFLRLALAEFYPATFAVIVETIGEPLTENERDVLICYRLIAPENQLEMTPMVTTAVLDTLLAFREDEEEEP